MKQIITTGEFDRWLSKLHDERAVSYVLARVKRLAEGNPGYNRFLGKIGEMKIDYGPGYRVYYFDTGKNIIVLLGGGDKRTQDTDIASARKLVLKYEREV